MRLITCLAKRLRSSNRTHKYSYSHVGMIAASVFVSLLCTLQLALTCAGSTLTHLYEQRLPLLTVQEVLTKVG
jgi:hypothetical protein